MPATITLSPEHGYVALSVMSIFVLNQIQGIIVGSWRRKAQVPYPNFYATKEEAAKSADAYKFNCAQRAHGNTLEHVPGAVALTMIAGARYPVIAASACGVWVLSRLMFTLNYVSGDPKKRNGRGAGLHYLAMLTLLGTTGYSAVTLIQGKW